MTDPLATVLAPYRSPAASRRYDEHVTELEHALQCADRAIDDGATDALVVASLLHDIGHLLDGGAATTGRPTGDDRHELVGARFLRRYLGPEVSGPVANHVEAKRYLVTTEAEYAASLSDGSVRTLELQGGPLPHECVCSFESRPRWDDAVRLRRWDDAAKVPGLATRSLEEHVDRIRRLLR